MLDGMDVAVVGAGLVGISTALNLARRGVGATVYEAAPSLGAGQSGHNSNVVHSGAFYAPGSLKADLAMRGSEMLEDFIRANKLPYRQVGKLIVQQKGEGGRFDELVERASANGVESTLIGSSSALHDFDPLAAGERALWLPSVAVTDFVAVLVALADEASLAGVEIEYMSPCVMEGSRLLVNDRDVKPRHVVVAAGVGFNRLSSDREWRVIGFKGSYRSVASPEPACLIYAVPDPRYPFLGVHVTPAIDGTVTAGPNATMHPPVAVGRAFLLAARNARRGLQELPARFSAGAMQSHVRRYVPGAVLGSEIVKFGVRAQAVDRRGRYADDFVIVDRPGGTFVANAPSPGATACLAIGEHIAARVLEGLGG
jgi:L-2-hydroxyglutarate oxidase LhgO